MAPISIEDFESGTVTKEGRGSSAVQELIDLMDPTKAYPTKELKELIGKAHQTTLNRLKKAKEAGLVTDKKLNNVTYWAIAQEDSEEDSDEEDDEE